MPVLWPEESLIMMQPLTTLVFAFLLPPSLQKDLLQLGEEVTGDVINPCKGEDVLSCVLAEVDLSAFDDETLVLPEGVEVKKKNNIQEPLSRSGLVDQATSVAYSGLGCEAVFSLRGERVMANVEYKDGTDFVLEPCGMFEGCHVWKEEDVAHMVEEEEEDVPMDMRADELMSSQEKQAFIQQGVDDDSTIVEYTIKYYYTKEFAEATDDIELYLDQVIAETNQGYINRNIPIRVKIFCIEASTLNDEESSAVLFSKFVNYKETVEELRGSADAAALLFMKTSSCGRGYLDSWDNGKTVTIQAKGCALGYYTMGHELAHNFGSTHDREHSSPNSYYSFGHGSYIEPQYRTIMAYYKTGYGSRVNYYSSSSVTYQGTATGSDTEDTARLIKENRFGFAAVGDESGTCASHITTTTTTTKTTTTTTTTSTITTATSTTSPSTTSTEIISTPDSVNPTSPTVTYQGKCRGVNRLYIGGDIISMTKVKKAKVCEKECNENVECTHWTWYKRRFHEKNLRKHCVLMSGDITEIIKSKKVVSGAIGQC